MKSSSSGFKAPLFETNPSVDCLGNFWDFDPTSKSRSDSSLKRCTRNPKFSQSRTNLAGSGLKSYKRLKNAENWKNQFPRRILMSSV